MKEEQTQLDNTLYVRYIDFKRGKVHLENGKILSMEKFDKLEKTRDVVYVE